MNVDIILKTKYRWEYIVLILVLIIIISFPSITNSVPSYIFLIGVIILFFLEHMGYIGYKKIGKLKISDDKIIKEMKTGSSEEIILKDNRKIYSFIDQDFDVKYKGVFICKFFLFEDQKAIINAHLRIGKNVYDKFNSFLEIWRDKNRLLVNVVTK